MEPCTPTVEVHTPQTTQRILRRSGRLGKTTVVAKDVEFMDEEEAAATLPDRSPASVAPKKLTHAEIRLERIRRLAAEFPDLARPLPVLPPKQPVAEVVDETSTEEEEEEQDSFPSFQTDPDFCSDFPTLSPLHEWWQLDAYKVESRDMDQTLEDAKERYRTMKKSLSEFRKDRSLSATFQKVEDIRQNQTRFKLQLERLGEASRHLTARLEELADDYAVLQTELQEDEQKVQEWLQNKCRFFEQ